MQVNDTDFENVRVVIASILDHFIDTFYCTSFDTSQITEYEQTGEYFAVLYNDEVHNYQEVIEIVSEALSTTENTGHDVAKAIDHKGRDLLHSGSFEDCKRIATAIKSIGLHCVVEPKSLIVEQEKSFDLFLFLHEFVNGDYNRPVELQGKIEMVLCQELVKAWHTRLETVDDRHRFVRIAQVFQPLDISLIEHAQVLTEAPALERISNRLNPLFNRLIRDATMDEDSDEEADDTDTVEYKGRLKPVDYPLPEAVTDALPELLKDTMCHFRLDYLMYFQRKTWKAFRILINELILKSFCFANKLTQVPDLNDHSDKAQHNKIEQYKIPIPVLNRRDIFAIRYFELYPLILWDVLFKEREPYNTINELGVQILTVPSIALSLEKQYNASFLFAEMLTKVVLYGQKQPFVCHIKNDTTDMILKTIDVSAQGIRTGLYYKLLHDLLFFVNTPENRQVIQSRLGEKNVVWSMMCLLTLLHGMDHKLRYSSSHIPFEQKTWRYAFNLNLSFNPILQQLAHLMDSAAVDMDDSVESIKTVRMIIAMYKQCEPYLSYVPGNVLFVGASVHLMLYRFISKAIVEHPSVLQVEPSAIEWITDRLSKYLDASQSDMATQLLHTEIYSQQVNGLYWIRNGQAPFYEMSIMKHIRHAEGSSYTQDMQLMRFHLTRDPLFFHKMLDLMQLDRVEALEGDLTKFKLLIENSLHFLVILHTAPPDSPIQDFAIHLLALKPHKESELEDYFEAAVLNEIDFEHISETRKTRQGIRYHLRPEIICDPFHYHYNRSHMREMADKHGYVYPHGHVRAAGEMQMYLDKIKAVLLAPSFLDLFKTSVIPELLVQLGIRSGNMSCIGLLLPLLHTIDADTKLTLKASLEQADELFDLNAVSLLKTSPVKDNKAVERQAHLIQKMQENQAKALTAYEKEMEDLSDEDEEEQEHLESPYLNLFSTTNRVYHAYMPLKEECVYCKESTSESLGYLAFLNIQPQLDGLLKYSIQISGCHLAHFRCAGMHLLYDAYRQSSAPSTNNACISCPICRSMVNCFVPIVAKGHYAHSVSLQSDQLEHIVLLTTEYAAYDQTVMNSKSPTQDHFEHMQNVITLLIATFCSESIADTTLLPLFGSMTKFETLYRHEPSEAEYKLPDREKQFFAHYFYFLRYHWPTTSADIDIFAGKGHLAFYKALAGLIDTPRTNKISIFAHVKQTASDLPAADKVLYMRLTRIFMALCLGLTSVDLNANTTSREDALFKEYQIPFEHFDLPKPALAALPDKYEDLFSMDLKCPNCQSVPGSPAICLVCGSITCFDGPCCADTRLGIYEHQKHIVSCTYLYGIFLMVKTCQIAFIHNGAYFLIKAPYVNSAGEHDPGLKRGKPLVCLEEDLSALTRQVISGDIMHYVNRIKYEMLRFQG